MFYSDHRCLFEKVACSVGLGHCTEPDSWPDDENITDDYTIRFTVA